MSACHHPLHEHRSLKFPLFPKKREKNWPPASSEGGKWGKDTRKLSKVSALCTLSASDPALGGG